MASSCIGLVAEHLQGENVLLLDTLKLIDFQGVTHRYFDVAKTYGCTIVVVSRGKSCSDFQCRICWDLCSSSYIKKGLVHFGLVCNIHQPELHRGMTFEFKAFLFSNDEAGEKYGEASQQ